MSNESKDIENEAEYTDALEELLSYEREIFEFDKSETRVYRLLGKIKKKELWKFDGQSRSFDEYVKKFGFNKGYVSRILRYAEFLDRENIKEGFEPSETALRPILKKCYDDITRRKIYRDACRLKKGNSENSDAGDAEKDEGGDKVAQGNSSGGDEAGDDGSCVENSDNVIDICPSAANIRQAISDFDNGTTTQIFLKVIDVAVPTNEAFRDSVIGKYAGKIMNVLVLTRVIQEFKRKGALEAADIDAIKELVEGLHAKEVVELEKAIENASAGDSDDREE